MNTPKKLKNSVDLLKVVNHVSGWSIDLGSLESAAKSAMTEIEEAISVRHGWCTSVVVGIDALDKFFRFKEGELFRLVKVDTSKMDIARLELIKACQESLTSPDKSLRYEQVSDKLYVREIDTGMKITGYVKKRLVPGDDGSLKKKKRYTTDLIIKSENDYRLAIELAKENAKLILQNFCT